MWRLARRTALIIIALGGGVALFWGWRTWQQSIYWPVRQVKFYGTYHHLKPKQLRREVTPLVTNGYFAAAPQRILKHIKTLPWVARAEVTRHWPGLIKVHFTEQLAVARWGHRGVMTEQGVIFEPDPATIPPFLPVFYAKKGLAGLIWPRYLRLNRILKPTGSCIKEAHISPSGAWSLVLDNQVVLKLGHDDLEQRLQHFAKSCHGVFKSRLHAVESVDLRYPSGMAVKWRAADADRSHKLASVKGNHQHGKKNG